MYPQEATIEEPSETTTGGETTSTWSPVLEDVPAQLSAPLRGEAREMERGDGTYVRVDRYLYLADLYPEIDEKMRVTCDGVTYDVEFADSDSHGTYTRLALRLVR